VSRAYGQFFPEAKIDGVELDAKVSEVGRRFFAMGENPNLEVFDEDARPFLRRTKERYDLIGVDAYRQPYIPFYLATTEFFRLARSRLTPEGALVVNVGHPERQDDLEKTLTATILSAFPHVVRYPIDENSTLLLASAREPDPAALRAAAQSWLPIGLRPLALRAAGEIGPPLRGGSVYTDDRAPVEWLIDASIVQYAAGDDDE